MVCAMAAAPISASDQETAADPLKDLPVLPIVKVLAVCSVVAVPAFPSMLTPVRLKAPDPRLIATDVVPMNMV
jgi:hypothetical protein